MREKNKKKKQKYSEVLYSITMIQLYKVLVIEYQLNDNVLDD